MARVKTSRKKIVKLLRLMYEKRVDPYTGNSYYYNTMTRKSKWTKPVNLGTKDLVEDEWVVMVNPDDNTPYFKQTIKPYEERTTKPEGFRVCLNCNFHLAKRRCLDCMYEYCLECWEAKHTTWTKHKWEKVHVGMNYCIMCKTAQAKKVCVHCNLDCFCNQCDALMHSKAARAKHSRIEI